MRRRDNDCICRNADHVVHRLRNFGLKSFLNRSVRAAGLSKEAEEEIKAVIQRHEGQLLSMDNPTSTLEELFLRIVRESEERPGRRAVEKK